MKNTNIVNAFMLVSYCKRNNLCTGMSIYQYDRLLKYAEESHVELTRRQKARDIACMIKICSDTDKGIDDLQKDIMKMFY